jgi:hypothetical protein
MIPRAVWAFVDHYDTSREILVVVATLSQHLPAQADARHDVIEAIAETVARFDLQGYDIRWRNPPT